MRPCHRRRTRSHRRACCCNRRSAGRRRSANRRPTRCRPICRRWRSRCSTRPTCKTRPSNTCAARACRTCSAERVSSRRPPTTWNPSCGTSSKRARRMRARAAPPSTRPHSLQPRTQRGGAARFRSDVTLPARRAAAATMATMATTRQAVASPAPPVGWSLARAHDVQRTTHGWVVWVLLVACTVGSTCVVCVGDVARDSMRGCRVASTRPDGSANRCGPIKEVGRWCVSFVF
mmetsp:Transcript_76017/g.209759  ORF Transcript_76017/g.209759 Transcript_76017/m.209759 type:complete len:233 (-) Transcript_76017:20-718(-)